MIEDTLTRMIVFYMTTYGMTLQEAIQKYIDDCCIAYQPPHVEHMFTKFDDMELTWWRTKLAEELLDNRLYYPAALMTFTFPELCGRVEFPDLEISSKASEDQQYFVKWFDTFITPYFGVKPEDKEVGISSRICLNGYLAYKLRCQLVHCRLQDLSDIPNNRKSAWMKKYKHVYFTITANNYTARTENYDSETVSFSIGLPPICKQINRVAESTYKKHKDNKLFLTDVGGLIN